MTDGFADRLTQLRARWEGDRSSRIFLQLAEEYRHLGRVQDALAVLNAGLEEHPGYLSALVAKGRCLLELGDAEGARPVLERVVQQDPTQMVANKLLVRACLETGEPARARQRLELYSLLNDSDPEIEELERRVEAMSRPSQAPDSPRLEEPAERPHMDPSAAQGSNDATAAPPQPPRQPPQPRQPLQPLQPLQSDVFDLGSAAPHPALPGGEDLFGLAAPGVAAAPEPPSRAEQAAAGPLPGSRARGEGDGAEPFPDLAPDHSRRIYLAHLDAEQIFAFATPPPPPLLSAPLAPPPPLTPMTTALPPAAPSPPAVAASPSTQATMTLAELYRRQGHVEEAERMFREVAGREPANASVRQALDQIERSRGARSASRPLDAPQLLAGSDPGAGPTARKAHLLQGYLTRLRQPRRSHVP
jgi:Flp pilus assembly protein TadD